MTGGTGGPARSWAYWRGPVRLGLSIAGILVTVAIYRVGGWGFDFYAYWRAPGDDPYGVAWGFGAYHYTPALLPLFAPFRLLDFATAYWVWTILMVGVLVWLCRSWTLAALASPPVAAELFHGNVHLLFAATVVVGRLRRSDGPAVARGGRRHARHPRPVGPCALRARGRHPARSEERCAVCCTRSNGSCGSSSCACPT